ncbi:MAG: glycosyltransferase family 4 protein [Prosthecobacter sp.]|uniref:glycosyltransferase family 4 protein n=1 Tax=Prosthecobacter sp. TaxID=1965333 RepID=UPI003902BF39
MKIAIVAGGQHLFGKEIIALELGAGLKAAGQQVSFVSSRWCGDGEFGRRLQKLGIPASFMRLGFISATLSLDCIRMTLDQLVRVPGLWLDYGRFLRQHKSVQVIHTNWHHLLVLWPFLNPKRDWFWLHDVISDKPQYRFVFQHLSRRLRAFIPVSNAVKEALLRSGIPAGKIQVIHNGLADPAGAGGSRLKSWLGLRVGIVGQVAPWKGHQDLLEAFARNAAAHPAAELHVFGEARSEFAQQLKRRAEALGVSNRLFWHGFVADKERIFGQMDLCVVPSQATEALPTVAIEAAFFGLPVVAARVGGMPEIVADGVTGLLHEAGNQTELASQLDTLLGSAELREQMGKSARQRALESFSRKRFVAAFEQLLDEFDSDDSKNHRSDPGVTDP